MTLKSALIGATAIAIALTSFELRPAAAGSTGITAITAQNATEIGAARRWRRGNPQVPLAAFGALAGAMVSIAVAQRRREADYGPYYGPHVYGPQYGAPAYRPYGRDYYSRWGGSGGEPGYYGPNVNVPGATNYGNAAGQNGQAPPASINAQQAGGSN
jgi:hypothetical protein